MINGDQINLFNLSPTTETPDVPAPNFDPDLIPTSATIPIPPGTYSDMTIMGEHCNRCDRCGLGATRTHAVVGRGNLHAPIMIVGEGPGQTEDETGLPFVGKAGQLLDKILDSVQLTAEQDVYIGNIVKCLDGYTRIFTREGAKRLNWIVKHQWAGEVLSVDENGFLVWKKVAGWHRSRLAGRSLYKVSFQNGKRHNYSEVGYIATGDHPVLTQRGWAAVEELQENDLVATGTPAPGPRGLQILLGSLLGDAGISADGQFHERHSVKQAAYLKLKARVLAGFQPKFRSVVARLSNGIAYESIGVDFPKNHYFHDLRREWYPNGRKDFPLAALSALSTQGLAIWYMDDGYWRRKTKNGKVRTAIDVEIALGDISQNTAEEVVKFFDRIGYRTYVVHRGTWRLQFRYREGFRFLTQIAEYVPSSMRYKLPEELHVVPLNVQAYQEEPVVTHWKPVTKKLLAPKTESYLVYCIDVEDTANFVTPAGVVHNCRPPGNRTPTPDEMAACLPYLLEQIRIVDPKIILLAGATAVKGLIGDKRGITQIRGQWMQWDGRWCMPVFHPAYLLRNQSRDKGSPKWLMWQDIQAVKAKLAELQH
jgi:uracil-DNA glycosylase family 4